MEINSARVVVNGGMKLPIGYRFHPTDEEVVVHYLKRKVFGFPLPASVIPVLDDVLKDDPWTLPGDVKEKRYFFSKKEGSNGNEATPKKSKDGCGYWKPIGKGKQIVSSTINQAIGIRKTYVLINGGKDRDSCRTSKATHEWIMHEYSLVAPPTTLPPIINTIQWVVCCVFQRKRKCKKRGVNQNMRPSTGEISRGMQEIRDMDPSSPCWSGITEISDSS